jgi:alanyl-tRNA synthetase
MFVTVQKAGGAEGGVLVVPGAQAFLLYDSFGFPLELTAEIAAERGAAVDVAGFEAAMEEQRRRSKDAAKARGGGSVVILTMIVIMTLTLTRTLTSLEYLNCSIIPHLMSKLTMNSAVVPTLALVLVQPGIH